MRFGLIAIGALAVALSGCAAMPTTDEASDAVLTLRNHGSWAWAVGIALIWSDLVLPIPQTAVVAALGIIYGTLLGGLLSTFALITGGLLGYGLMRTSARRLAQRLIRQQSLRKMESLFDRGGAWAIVLTRSLPFSVPEAMALLAGLAGGRRRRLGRSAGAGPCRELPAAHPVATNRALSDPAARPLGGRRWSHFLRRTSHHFGGKCSGVTLCYQMPLRETHGRCAAARCFPSPTRSTSTPTPSTCRQRR